MKPSKPQWIDGLAFLFPLSVYFLTCAQGIGFGDTAIIIDNIYNNTINSQVNTHPLSVFIGNLFMLLPLDNIAYKANLMSVVAGAISVFLLYIALCLALEQRFVPLLAAALFTFCKSMWWHSTVVENYAISSVITGIALIAFVQLWKTENHKWMQWLFFWAGLGIFNHMQMGFLGLGVGVTFLLQLPRQKHKWSFFLRCGIAFIIGLSPWLITLLMDYNASGDFQQTVKNAFVGFFANTFFSVSFAQGLRDTGIVYFLEYPHFFLPLPFIGIYFAGLKMQAIAKLTPSYWGILTYFLVNTVCFTYYNTWDRFAFLLQSFMVMTFLGAFVLAAIVDFAETRRWPLLKYGLALTCAGCMAWSVFFYSSMTEWGKSSDSYWHRNYNNIYSSNLYEHSEFVINPNKRNYREVEQYADRLQSRLPEGAIYIDDDSRTYYPIANYFQKYYNWRKDVKVMLVNSWSIDGWGNSPDDVAKMIERAYRQKQSVFLPSLNWPYSLFLRKLPQEIKFQKFPIGGDRWIFEMASSSTKDGEYQFTQNKSVNYVDIDIFYITEQSNTFYSQQMMSGYEGNWHFEDHLFLNLLKADSQISFALSSNFEGFRKLKLHLTKADDFGVFRITFNGEPLVDKIDLYNEKVTEFVYTVKQQVWIKEGKNLLTFQRVNEGDFDKGYRGGIDGIEYAL